jgi:hypothetical protein
VIHQHQFNNTGTLFLARNARLEQLGWDVLESAWEDMYAELKRYKDKHGHWVVAPMFSVKLAVGHGLTDWHATRVLRNVSASADDARGNLQLVDCAAGVEGGEVEAWYPAAAILRRISATKPWDRKGSALMWSRSHSS